MLSKTLMNAATTCGLLIACANAHMVIRSPVPYGQDSLTNSPLEPDGSDFPCKQRSGVYDVTKMNNMAVGVPQELAFTGGATHGGGSCQVSVTMDKEPTKDSDWRVIHSIVGGCPTNETGNMSGDAKFDGASTFQFSIPKGMPNGQYTLAWTWFNKVGNREMYMNCAPITVSGGTDNDDALKSLPAMFVANIPTTECTTTEGDDVVFPDPGSSVETAGSATPGKPTGPKCGAAAAPADSYGSNTSDSPTTTQAPGYGAGSGSPSNVASTLVIPTYGVAKGVGDVVTATTLATVTASGYSSVAAGSTQATGASQPPTSYSESSAGSDTSQSTDTGSNGTTSTGGCTSGAVQCNSPGNVVCIGDSQWGLCNIDNCAVPRDLAAGTSCSGGVVSKRHVSRHVRDHLHHARSH